MTLAKTGLAGDAPPAPNLIVLNNIKNMKYIILQDNIGSDDEDEYSCIASCFVLILFTNRTITDKFNYKMK